MDDTIAGVAPSQYIPPSITNKGEENVNFISGHATKNFKKLILISLGLFVVALVILAGTYAYIITKVSTKTQAAKSTIVSPTPTPTPITQVNPLTGSALTGTAITNLNRPPLAVMIENSIPARPQSGLNQADIVYEALTEGGITRFMAVFLGNTPSLVGPVRSARIYYLDWVSEYNAIYAHWGENNEVIPLLTTEHIRNIDALVQPGTSDTCTLASGLFCRDPLRDAPHNGYGFPQRIWNAGAGNGWSAASTISSWNFKNDATEQNRGSDKASILISFMPNDIYYAVKWVYDKAANSYTRYDVNDQNTASYIMQTDKLDNTPITAKNLILQYVDGSTEDDGGKVIYHLTDIGSGKASIFMDGQEVDGTWKKDSLTGRTQFFDNAGNPISFDKGKTWISLLVNGQGSFTIAN